MKVGGKITKARVSSLKRGCFAVIAMRDNCESTNSRPLHHSRAKNVICSLNETRTRGLYNRCRGLRAEMFNRAGARRDGLLSQKESDCADLKFASSQVWQTIGRPGAPLLSPVLWQPGDRRSSSTLIAL